MKKISPAGEQNQTFVKFCFFFRRRFCDNGNQYWTKRASQENFKIKASVCGGGPL